MSYRTILLALPLLALLSACGDDDDALRTPTASPTNAATATPPPPTVTHTLAPPTATASASATPTPSATATASEFDIIASAPRFIIPGDTLPHEFQTFSSNNNVDILFSGGRLFLAWRAAPNHFAGPDTHMYIMSSGDGGATWQFEHYVFLATDMREPRLLDYAGYLQLMFFEAGSDSGTFTPIRLRRTRRLGPAQWSELETLTDAGEVPWDLKQRDGIAYRTSYLGEHYGAGETSEVAVYFKQSTDGTAWTNVGGREYVYYGGVSEVAFEFDTDGTLWAVTRNEDGDASGFGSHLCSAPANDLSNWNCPAVTDPDRYDSPEMFRHGNDIYLLARRDVGGPYDGGDSGTLAERRGRYLIAYSLRPKRFALYKIDKTARRVVHVMDLPGVGDTSFPSVQQTGPDSYLIANYTSPLDDPDITWLRGQTSPRGTQIYLLTLDFVPYYGAPRSPTPTWTPSPTPTAPVIEAGAPVAVDPVFAAPGTPLVITWPDVETPVGQLTLGDGTTVGPEITTHTYATNDDTIFPLNGFVEVEGAPLTLSGAVARSATRFETPLNGFTLTQPLEPVVQQVIRGVMPQFLYALDADQLAIATDPTGQRDIRFEQVTTSALTRNPDGSFASAPATYSLELSGVGGTHTGLYVRLAEAVFEGAFNDALVVVPLRLHGQINVLDIVDVVVVLAGLDRPAAIGFVAGLFGFDPENPPETVPFAAELGVTASP
jgi:hypothetical protein